MPEAATQLKSTAGPTDAAVDKTAQWHQVMGLPCRISVEVRVSSFAVKDLLRLAPQAIVSSQSLTTANLPVKVNGVPIGWCEFEVLGNRVAVRLTEIA